MSDVSRICVLKDVFTPPAIIKMSDVSRICVLKDVFLYRQLQKYLMLAAFAC